MAYSVQTWADDDVTKPLSAARMTYIENGIAAAHALAASAQSGGTADFGAVLLDSFAGANDDAKLTAAMSAVGADTYPRTIQLTNRNYAFSTIRTPYEGLRIMGPRGYGNPERGGDKMASRISLSTAGAWLTHSSGADMFSVSLHDLAFVGGSGASVIGGTSNWYCLSMQSIFSSGLKSVVGTQAQKALLTAASFTGDWEINNCYDGAFHMGGSDNVFWSDGMLLDSGTAFAGSGQAHIWCDGLDKSYVGPLYITAEGDWTAIRVTGNAYNNVSNNQGGPLTFYGLRVEGRNENAPSFGRLVSVEGGNAQFNGCAFNFAMADPSNAAIGRTDLGVIQHTGGQLDVNGCTYDRAVGVAETVPFVYTNTAADCMVTRIKRSARGGAWTGRPRVVRPVANADNIVVSDASITKATV